MTRKGYDSVPRLGELLVGADSLRHEQVGMLLDEQRAHAVTGVHSRLGEIAVRKGWARADEVNAALHAQARAVQDTTDPGRILLSLGWITPTQWEQAWRRVNHSAEPVEEAIAELGMCTPERLRIASTLAIVRAANALRGISGSSFAPYNIMELMVGEETGAALEADSLCACSQCWSNVFALALNTLPARYVSDHARIADFYARFRAEYGALVRERVAAALSQVRDNPKTSCWSRFSSEIIDGRQQENAVEEVVVRVSARHVHLTRRAVDVLFGAGEALTRLKDLHQPGQYAANQTVTLAGPGGVIEHVRVLGPLRDHVQVEISGTDQFVLGLKAPVRESGRLGDTTGIILRGPAGELSLPDGVIRALRHVHMPPADADRIGVKNGSLVSVRLLGDRTMILEGVLVRVSPQYVLEMHIDTDEANAAGIPPESTGQMLIPQMAV